MIARGNEEFFVFLPRCKATVERTAADEYKVVGLEIDSGYLQLNGRQQRAGLYRAAKQDNRWEVSYLSNGELVPDPGSTKADAVIRPRFVGISDADHDDASSAAASIAPLITKAPGAGGKFFNNYDFHFTPSSRSLGGLKNYKVAINPNSNELAHGSAIMLAHSMYKAKDIKGVVWVSEFGGSSVLTQAMKILSDQGVKLSHHSAFLCRPSTSTNEALLLAHKLDLKLDRDFAKTDTLDYIGNRSQVAMIINRAKHEDGYTKLNACWDLIGQSGKVQGLAGYATAALSFAGIATTVPSIPIVTALAGALGVAAGALKMGDSLAQSVAPRAYNKHIGKLK